ncbi:gluconokinase [Sodalis sp. dw_96]|uniref:gluconokinase n=1 Tax=Sodalis sp. dw_96 TaxID=2719794 RepID=UPI001BD4F7EA|nr:gluconokinase [Sodalis sp. dw_96]
MTHITQHVLAIDIGSSSLRAALFDVNGRQSGQCIRRSYSLDTDAMGKATLDADALFDDLFDALDELMSITPERLDITAVGISTFWHSLTGINDKHAATFPIITWADGRSAHEAAALKYSGIARHLHSVTGCPVHSSYWPARLRWLAAQHETAFDDTRYWLSAADLLFLRLFGRIGTSISMASGSGLCDLNQKTWSREAMGIARIQPTQLPPISDDPQRGLLSPWGERWPRLAVIPWYPAWGDGACSNIGAGANNLDSLVLMLGTSGSMRVVWPADSATLSDAGLWCYRVDDRRFAGGMALSEGGNAAAWANRLLDKETGENIDERVANLEPDAHGLCVLPYFLGSRSPQWSEGRTASITGITAATTPVDIYRAMLESVGLRFAFLKNRLERAWPGKRRIIATGAGFLRSAVWPQIVADCLGEPIDVSDVEEGSLRGAALLVLEKQGQIGKIEFPINRTVYPNSSAHEKYKIALERQADFDKHMIGMLQQRLDELR